MIHEIGEEAGRAKRAPTQDLPPLSVAKDKRAIRAIHVGQIRREKGKKELTANVEVLWRDCVHHVSKREAQFYS